MVSGFHVCADPFRALAEAFVREFAARDRICIAVSGGSTPKRLYKLLAEEFRAAIAWEQIQLFQVDERCVPPEHPDSNWRLIEETLLPCMPEAQAHRIEAERDGAECAYEALLRQKVPAGSGGIPKLDLVLMGMGADGHTASLFPGTEALGERERLVVRNQAPHLEHARITMTFPLLEAACRRWFLVTGAEKAEAVRDARAGENPAGRIAAVWFLDPTAAALL